MRSGPNPKRPFHLVSVDLNRLPETDEGMEWMAVAVCRSSKFVEARALPNKEALTVAIFLLDEVFARYGYVRYMITDRGKEFCVEAADALATKLGISRRFATPYRPQGNGTAERYVGVTSERLAKITAEGGANGLKSY